MIAQQNYAPLPLVNSLFKKIQEAGSISKSAFNVSLPDLSQSRTKSVPHHRCISILWLKGVSDSAEINSVAKSLKELQGVSNTQVMRERPALIKVEYYPRHTFAAQMIKSMSAQGKTLFQVGC